MWFFDIIKVIILGIVEGITEWLPVSSTGHMILVDEFLKLNQSAEFKEMFLVVIQLGAILAVVIMYFNKLNPFSKKKTKEQQKDTINMWLKVIVGVIPAGVLGVLFDKTLEKYFYNFPTVAFTLVLYGILFIVVENNPKFKTQKIKRFLLKLRKFGFAFSFFQFFILILGMFVAFVVSVLAIKMLMRYIRKHDFKVFGYYRIVLGIILIIYYFIH